LATGLLQSGRRALQPNTGRFAMTDRMPPIPPSELTPAQREAAAVFKSDRGKEVFGPFVPLLRSPQLMLRFQQVGIHCRYNSAIGLRLTEFVILMVARRFSQSVEWAIHAPIAAEAGVAPDTIAALLDGRRPPAMAADEAAVHDAVVELWSTHAWSDATYAAMLARFGEEGIIDLVGTAGYYASLAMVMNVARTDAPGGFQMPRLP
jgi:4-carboxymuconolactone decarboxylase